LGKRDGCDKRKKEAAQKARSKNAGWVTVMRMKKSKLSGCTRMNRGCGGEKG